MKQSFAASYSDLSHFLRELTGFPLELLRHPCENLQETAALHTRKTDALVAYLSQLSAAYPNATVSLSVPPQALPAKDLQDALNTVNDPRAVARFLPAQRRLFGPSQNDCKRFFYQCTLARAYYADSARQQTTALQLKSRIPTLLRDYAAQAQALPDGADTSLWSVEPAAGAPIGELYLGDFEEPIPENLSELLSAGSPWVEGSWLRAPLSYSADMPFTLFLDRVVSTREEQTQAMQQCSSLLRGLLYQMLHALPLYGSQLFYIDPTHSCQALQELQPLSEVMDGNAYQLHPQLFPDHRFRLLQKAGTQQEANALLQALDSYIGQVNQALGGEESVSAYNARRLRPDGTVAEGQTIIPQRLVVFENIHGLLSTSSLQILKKLAESGPRCGVSLVLTCCRLRDDPQDDLEAAFLETKPDVLEWDSHNGQEDCVLRVNTQVLHRPASPEISRLRYVFRPWYRIAPASGYVSALCDAFRPSTSGHYFFEDLISPDDADIWGAQNGAGALALPMGVNKRGQLVYYRIGGSDAAHALLAGSTGCGKSTLLHGLINSVLVQYKPTDVQLWLSDYKGNEFYRYIENAPPHIKFVGIDACKEYTLGFLDKLNEEYHRRASLFGSLTSVADYRKAHGEASMPHLLVIIDEFHKMSDHVKDEPSYKLILTNLLKESRFAGMTFLLADQTCGIGLQGLSEEGKLQLTGRFSMVSSVEEYQAVFGVNNVREIPALTTLVAHQVTLRRTETVLQNGLRENVSYFEQLDTLDISPALCDRITAKAIALYGPNADQQYATRDRLRTADWAELQQVEQARPNRRGYPFYLGVPLGLERHFSLRLLPNFGENIMSICSSDRQQAALLQILLENIRHQLPRYEIYLCADEQDDTYAQFEPWLLALAKQDSHLHPVLDGPALCRVVAEQYDEVQHRQRKRGDYTPVFLFWLGVESQIRQQELYPAERPAALQGQVSAPAAPVLSIQQQLDLEFAKLMGEPLPEAAQPTPAEDVDEPVYNACADIRYLVQNSPRQGIFHCVFYSSVSSVKRNKCIPLSEFNHKLAFSMGRDDALDYLGSSRLLYDAEGQPIGPDTCVYYNGVRAQSFVPYLLAEDASHV